MRARSTRLLVGRRWPAAAWAAVHRHLVLLDLRRRCWEEHRDLLIARVADVELDDGEFDSAHAALERWLGRDSALLVVCLVAEVTRWARRTRIRGRSPEALALAAADERRQRGAGRR